MRRLLLTALVGIFLAITGSAWAQASAPVGAPPGFVAPAEPKADDTNAERARSQPGNNAPLWRSVRGAGEQTGVTNLPGVEMATLIQPFAQYPGSPYTTAGEAWRQTRNQWIIPYGGALLLVVLVALAIFYWRVGPIGGHIPETGRKIERFTPFERAAHGLNMIAFVLLALTGVVIAFGKFLLLPLLGPLLFGWLSFGSKNVHNFAGPVFAVTLLVMILTFVRSNLPQSGDWRWLKKLGNLTGEREIPSHRFNAGEKVVFWGGVFVLGLISVGSGLFVNQLVPGFLYTRGEMQIGLMIHGVSAALMIAMFIGHAYIGTIGMKGAWRGMSEGYVDEAWAKEHHELWYEDIKAGKIPAQRSVVAPPDVLKPDRVPLSGGPA